MKAVTFDPRSDTFQLEDVPRPRPGPTDVLVEVEACGLNPVDAKIVGWKSLVPDMQPGWVTGLDVAGRVVEVGTEVSGWSVGDRVLCHGNMFRSHGGFAEVTVQDAAILLPHPHLEPHVAAATPCAGWTAWRALVDRLRLPEHGSVLILGGSGGVGSFAVQIARHFGLQHILATCSTGNVDFVRSLGATHVLDYSTEDVLERVREITGGLGVAIALDAVGRDNDIIAADALGFEGQMLELVDLVRPEAYDDAFGRGLGFHQFTLGGAHRAGPAGKAALTAAGRSFSRLVAGGEITVPRLKSVTLDEVPEALDEIRAGHTVGKVVMAL